MISPVSHAESADARNTAIDAEIRRPADASERRLRDETLHEITVHHVGGALGRHRAGIDRIDADVARAPSSRASTPVTPSMAAFDAM